MSSSIPFSKVDEGIQKAVDNATRSLNDAVFLHDKKKYQSSILLSMLSYEESGKALLLMDYKSRNKEITRSQWTKKFCSHRMKNLISLRAIWKDAGYISRILDSDVSQAKFDVDWKNVWTYADYDLKVRNGRVQICQRLLDMEMLETSLKAP
jgi:AbiV family abortive infection protein